VSAPPNPTTPPAWTLLPPLATVSRAIHRAMDHDVAPSLITHRSADQLFATSRLEHGVAAQSGGVVDNLLQPSTAPPAAARFDAINEAVLRPVVLRSAEAMQRADEGHGRWPILQATPIPTSIPTSTPSPGPRPGTPDVLSLTSSSVRRVSAVHPNNAGSASLAARQPVVDRVADDYSVVHRTVFASNSDVASSPVLVAPQELASNVATGDAGGPREVSAVELQRATDQAAVTRPTLEASRISRLESASDGLLSGDVASAGVASAGVASAGVASDGVASDGAGSMIPAQSSADAVVRRRSITEVASDHGSGTVRRATPTLGLGEPLQAVPDQVADSRNGGDTPAASKAAFAAWMQDNANPVMRSSVDSGSNPRSGDSPELAAIPTPTRHAAARAAAVENQLLRTADPETPQPTTTATVRQAESTRALLGDAVRSLHHPVHRSTDAAESAPPAGESVDHSESLTGPTIGRPLVGALQRTVTAAPDPRAIADTSTNNRGSSSQPPTGAGPPVAGGTRGGSGSAVPVQWVARALSTPAPSVASSPSALGSSQSVTAVPTMPSLTTTTHSTPHYTTHSTPRSTPHSTAAALPHSIARVADAGDSVAPAAVAAPQPTAPAAVPIQAEREVTTSFVPTVRRSQTETGGPAVNFDRLAGEQTMPGTTADASSPAASAPTSLPLESPADGGNHEVTDSARPEQAMSAGETAALVSGASGSANSAKAEGDLDLLAARLYDRIRFRLQRELLEDRERSGMILDGMR
jgi:hypothetical protein